MTQPAYMDKFEHLVLDNPAALTGPATIVMREFFWENPTADSVLMRPSFVTLKDQKDQEDTLTATVLKTSWLWPQEGKRFGETFFEGLYSLRGQINQFVWNCLRMNSAPKKEDKFTSASLFKLVQDGYPVWVGSDAGVLDLIKGSSIKGMQMSRVYVGEPATNGSVLVGNKSCLADVMYLKHPWSFSIEAHGPDPDTRTLVLFIAMAPVIVSGFTWFEVDQNVG